jgi:hypothetical protein
MAQVKISELPVAAAALNAMQLEVNDAGTSRSLTLEKVFDAPTFTGVPAAPTAAAGTDTTQIATTAHVFAATAKSADADFTVDPTLLATRATIKTLIDASGGGLGVGQTWQDMTGSRAAGTTYQNTTGGPIEVAVSAQVTSTRRMEVSSDNVTFHRVGWFTNTSGIISTACFTVPNNHYYKTNSASSITVSEWMELR